jgi:hypothetical protein
MANKTEQTVNVKAAVYGALGIGHVALSVSERLAL